MFANFATFTNFADVAPERAAVPVGHVEGVGGGVEDGPREEERHDRRLDRAEAVDLSQDEVDVCSVLLKCHLIVL